MKPGDLVKFKCPPGSIERVIQYGTFVGFRVFDGKYECAEVMWFNSRAPNGDAVSTVQKDLIEVVL